LCPEVIGLGEFAADADHRSCPDRISKYPG
jgi:hypothetical protein